MDNLNAENDFNNKIWGEMSELLSTNPNLFKYMGVDIGIQALEKQTIAFTKPLAFNDPYDCSPSLIDFTNIQPNDREDLISRCLEGLSPAEKESKLKQFNAIPDKRLTQFLSSTAMNDATASCRVSCFSKNCDNLLMWAHYARGHTGICLAYDLKKLFFTSRSEPGSMMIPVEYCKMFNAINYYTKANEAIIQWLRVKGDMWSYEQEVRIVVNDLIFNAELKSLRPLEQDTFTALFLGNKIEPHDESTIISLCVKNYPGMPIYKMEPVEREFKLMGRRLN